LSFLVRLKKRLISRLKREALRPRDALPDLGKPQAMVRQEIWEMLRTLNLPSVALNRAISPAEAAQ
jgi:hypothetical protein